MTRKGDAGCWAYFNLVAAGRGMGVQTKMAHYNLAVSALKRFLFKLCM